MSVKKDHTHTKKNTSESDSSEKSWEERFAQWHTRRTQRTSHQIALDGFGDVPTSFSAKSSAVHSRPSRSARWKLVLLAIPLAIFLYVLYANVIASQDFVYRYEAEDDVLTPANRISAVSADGTYRELTGHLVYLTVPIARGAETVDVRFRFLDTLPADATMSVGAKDQEVWHYTYDSVYNPALHQLDSFPHVGTVYALHEDAYPVSLDALPYERNVVVAADEGYTPLANTLTAYAGESVITSSLRGAHTAYVYAGGDLVVRVTKQDINWYEGADPLEITVSDSTGVVVGTLTIADDGETGIASDESAELQTEELRIAGLAPGVYTLSFGDFDGLIREISVNTGKIVFESVFLADNSLYGLETKDTVLYTRLTRDEQMLLLTYHAAGLQEIPYTHAGELSELLFDTEDSTVPFDLSAGEYSFVFPENDVIVSGTPYYSFSSSQYFEPFTQKVVPLRNDIAWLTENVDYVVTSYQSPESDGDWLIGSAAFDLAQDELYVTEEGLSLVFHTPHLADETASSGVPLDWIEVTVHKPGVFGR